MTKKRILSALLAAVLAVGLTACGGANTPASSQASEGAASTASSTAESAAPAEATNDQVLVIGTVATFSEKWNPYIAENAYDRQVTDQIFVPVLQKNAQNELVEYAGNITSEAQADGGVLYTVKLKEGMKFSDGTPITIDDYIHRLYVHSDPSFTGALSLLPTPIEGMAEYYYDDPNYTTAIEGFTKTAEEKYSTANITFDDFLAYSKETALAGWWNPDNLTEFTDYITGEGAPYTDSLAAIDATKADDVFKIVAQIEYDKYRDAYDTYNWYLDTQKKGYATGNLADGVNVPEISGVKKVDDLTCTVKYTKVDIYGDRTLGDSNGIGSLAPKAYYGEITKGDVSKIISNMVPVGSGPYKWSEYGDNICTLVANPDFFLGAPKIGTIRWQFIPEADQIASLASGAIDIIDPTGNKQNVAELATLQNIRYDLTDNAGYGYLGMNCENLPLNVRKGLLSLMNRAPSVEGYYGPEIAKVIERPMTTVLAEYPQDAKPFYTYSRDEALKYFTEAGYTQKDGKLVDANGKQLVVNVYIGGEGQGSHPVYAMIVQAAEDLKALGGELQIQDVQFGVLMSAMDDGTADMFTLAWSEVNSCDKTDQFASTGGQNKFRFKDPKMDAILEKIVTTIDLTERKKLVSEMLDMAIDNCVEFPTYQRKNILAYNKDVINMDTIPAATAFYNYEDVLWQVELNG